MSTGRLWVVEMADYPLGMDGKGKAGGRVVMLSRTQKTNGRYDKRTCHRRRSELSHRHPDSGVVAPLVTAAPDILLFMQAEWGAEGPLHRLLARATSSSA